MTLPISFIDTQLCISSNVGVVVNDNADVSEQRKDKCPLTEVTDHEKKDKYFKYSYQIREVIDEDFRTERGYLVHRVTQQYMHCLLFVPKVLL
jgi:hypothetical protein